MAGWANSRTQAQRLSGRALQRRNARILARDGGICWICGRAGADTVDHVLALARGGTDDDTNLKAAHRACNARKAVTADRMPSRRRPAEAHPGTVDLHIEGSHVRAPTLVALEAAAILGTRGVTPDRTQRERAGIAAQNLRASIKGFSRG